STTCSSPPPWEGENYEPRNPMESEILNNQSLLFPSRETFFKFFTGVNRSIIYDNNRFFLSVLLNASKHAITTPVCTDCSKRNGCKSFFLFMNPKTCIRPDFCAGMAITVPGSCQA